MPTAPQIMPTQIDAGVAPGISFRIAGELDAILHCRLDGSIPMDFEHHVGIQSAYFHLPAVE